MTEFVDRVRGRLITDLRAIFAGVPEWDLVDFPHHFNCGDSAIWLGEVEIAEELGVRVVSATSSPMYRRDKLRAEGPVVIHGGGNFGGLYPQHDDLRIRIMTDFPTRPIVQMPQSIQLTNSAGLERLKRAIGLHRDFTLLVRDRRSLATAQREFDCRIELVPDAAFALGDIDRRPAVAEAVLQARQDKEASDQGISGHPTVDWNSAGILSLRNVGRSAVTVAGKLPAPSLTSAMANRFARQNLRWAIRTLSGGHVLVTDRLHGHIIATLCGIEHIVVNDRYGKVRALWDTWTHDAPVAAFAPTWRDAETALAERLSRRSAS
ncbi:polysaccharide pyruvyl transferase [Mycobacterium sp. IS-1496]|uniref:polysaccharide pyruvyl transferase family protein n=1 Tax=Mycobacterium sp. IS-1496 TaxID=1772284 RepID=UPI0007417B20|nr:polysaccharide pyruvyl transferase family protein [Mycobacterium sp. IS-1496]KUI21754.1 polysaccharide pyruvyl transferase [Mycobacterium sp. IS-1496]